MHDIWGRSRKLPKHAQISHFSGNHKCTRLAWNRGPRLLLLAALKPTHCGTSHTWHCTPRKHPKLADTWAPTHASTLRHNNIHTSSNTLATQHC